MVQSICVLFSVCVFVSEKDARLPFAELLAPGGDRVRPGLRPHDPRRKALQQPGRCTLSEPGRNPTICSYSR